MSKPAAGAKATPPPQSQPSVSVSLNDETWTTHVYAIFPDDKLITSNASSLQPLYDSIGLGYRQRFTVFQKSDLMAWFQENNKLDACKDFKTALDAANGNENEVSDSLMAKLIKYRLLLLKQDGIAAREAARIAAETPATPEKLEPPKGAAAKAPAKDDKARAKSPAAGGKKPPAKGNDKKAPEPVSRPESALPAEISKRKGKLREKGSKSETKIQAIGDEPLDGPDNYILLKDFTNMGIFNALMEDNEIPIHTIFRLCVDEDTATPRPPSAGPIEIKTLDTSTVPDLSTTNRVLFEAREWCTSSNDDSLWRNIAWSVAKLSKLPFEPKEIFDAFAQKLYSQLKVRREFKDFYAAEKVVVVPSVVDVATLRNELRSLSNLLDVVPYQTFLTTEVLVGVLTEQAVRVLKAEEDTEGTSGMEPVSVSLIDEMGALATYLDKSIKKFVGAKPVPEGHENENLKSTRLGDNLGHSKILLGDLNAYGVNVPELINNVLDIYPAIKFQDSLRQGRPSVFTDPAVSRQRITVMAELRKSTSSSFNEALRVMLQNEIEEMLGGKDALWNLNEWSWAESLDKTTLAQVLQEAKISHPVVTTKFCEKTGKLLVAMNGHGRVGVNKYDGNLNLAVKTKVNFGLFHELNERYKSHLALPPKSKVENRPPVYYSGDSVVEQTDNFTVLYPSDGSHITVHREQHLNFKQEIRTSLYSDNNHISWASATQSKAGPYLTAVFENNIVFSFIEKEGATSATLSSPDGLILEFRGNGHIVQKYDSMFSASSLENPIRGQAAKELSRVITLDGTVIRFMNNSVTEVLSPDGTTSTNLKGIWTTTTNDGSKVQTNLLGEASELPPIRVAKETIIALSETIVTREDMVTITTKKDGSTYAEHADGTLIYTQLHAEEPSVVTIEKPDTPLFTIKDAGNKIVVRLVDGTTVEQTDKTHYRIYNDIHTYDFETSTTGQSKFTVMHSKRPTSGSNVEYALDWVNGTFESTDALGSRYEVNPAGICSVSPAMDGRPSITQLSNAAQAATVDASGNYVKCFLERPISRPLSSPSNPPKLFIIEDDGSGVQLLRDVDLFPFFKDQICNPNTEILEDPMLSDGLGLFVTVIGKSPIDTKKLSSGEVVFYRQLLKYPTMTRDRRNQINTDLVNFESILAKMEIPVDTEAQPPKAAEDPGEGGVIENEPLAAASSGESETIVLGQDRLETQQEILSLFKLQKHEFGSRPSQPAILEKKKHHVVKPPYAHRPSKVAVNHGRLSQVAEPAE
ncbi:hypothetical protein HDU79_005265 [Rhizoclosmatium sp. JEL0117]|nr:hypothetical protein HDU79_005265 [Rhizoclosmatium sp. JEL0117]